MKHSHRGKGNFLTGFIIALILLMTALIVYIVNWYTERSRIAADNARYLEMYAAALATEPVSPSPAPEDAQIAGIGDGGESGDPGKESSPDPGDIEAPGGAADEKTPAPTPEASSPVSGEPEEEPSPAVDKPASTPAKEEASPTHNAEIDASAEAAGPDTSPAPSADPAGSPVPVKEEASSSINAEIDASAEAAGPDTSPAPSAEAAGSPDPAEEDAQAVDGTSPSAADGAAPSPSESVKPEAVETPLPTADADTLVFAMPTRPPVQASFGSLLVANPETIGYLAMGDLVSLPVVQRENDNEFYLDHGFEQQEAREGALFLDGLNRLVPEDECLIVYGHNMKNGTMFGQLSAMRKADVLKKHAIVRFDTLYANHLYVAFAAFYASMDRDSANYFEVRRFLMQPDETEDFIAALKKRSRVDVPVDVAYGDSLLLLVTCDYHGDDSRFILALRRLRDGESEEDVLAAVKKAK